MSGAPYSGKKEVICDFLVKAKDKGIERLKSDLALSRDEVAKAGRLCSQVATLKSAENAQAYS